MFVSKIEWISLHNKEPEDNDARDATVTISDGIWSCDVFCWMCNFKVGDYISEPLHVFCTEGIMIENELFIKKQSDPFSYEISGILISTSPDLVKVGDLLFELDLPPPGDIKTGSIIGFVCSRVDLWKYP